MKAVHTVPSKIPGRHTIASLLNSAAGSCVHLVRKGGAALFAALLVLGPVSSSAAPLNLADSPLFLGISVKPNVMLVIDDSGSMDFEVLLPTNDGALWWNDSADSFVDGSNNLNFVGDMKYTYLFPNGYNKDYDGRRVYRDDTGGGDHFAIPPTKEFAYTRSPGFNKAYYNPDVTYTPWISFGSTTFGDVDPKNAPWDPYFSGAGTVDLTQDIDESNSYWTFRFLENMKYEDGTTVTSTIDDKQVGYFPPTYYRIAGTPDNTGYSASAVQLEGFEPDGTTTLEKYEIKPGNYNTAADYSAAIQNFANWFTYYRRRHQAMRAGMGKAFDGLSFLRTGLFTINDRVNVTMWDFDTQSDTFYSNLYASVNRGGTPNREALDHAGQQYERTDADAPITAECQQNFGILFTDGYSTTWTGAGVGNADKLVGPYSGTAPYADDYSNTLADIAMHYYKKNLRPDLLAGKVPTSPEDQNSDPHMVTFTVGLGAKGWIYGVTHNTIADAYATPPAWQDPNGSRDPVQIDELYHAAINGRGDLLNAKTPEQIATVMKEALQDITARTASASAAAVNSRTLSTTTRIYHARFTSGEWSGELRAIPIDASGAIQPEAWNAKDVLISQSASGGWDGNRQIMSWDGTSGVAFRWGSLNAGQRTALDADPASGTPDGEGAARLDYLRGDSSNEGTGNDYRMRKGGFKLGDITDSAPIFVGPPPYLPDLESVPHSNYRDANTSRRPMLYVGANDGMLHGFDANTGEEKMAYVPNMVFPSLNQLTDPAYAHRYYVNGSPTAGDVFFGGAWHTMLVGGLGRGGKGYFALDISDPDGANTASLAFDEGNAANIVQWEFTDAATPGDMGFTYGKPTIAKMHNGSWAAIVGNGYNSVNENAVLYIVDIKTGAIIRKFDLGGAPANGLSTPAVVDADADYIADYIYAGDLKGNMWKVDVRATTKTAWQVFYRGGGNDKPLFQARDGGGNVQPITERPEVSLHPDGLDGFMVYFGTGKYLEVDDRVPKATPVHTFYGIWDRNPTSGTLGGTASAAVLRSDLLAQTLSTTTLGSATVREVTDNPITWRPGATTPDHLGWRVDLPVTGEMSVSNPVLVGGELARVIFTTLIPETAGTCGFGGTSWLMELNPQNGGRFDQPVFDVNEDGVFDDNDLIGGAGGIPPSGVNPNIGILPEPVIIQDTANSKIIKGLTGSTGAVETNTQNAGPPTSGREGWRQLR